MQCGVFSQIFSFERVSLCVVMQINNITVSFNLEVDDNITTFSIVFVKFYQLIRFESAIIDHPINTLLAFANMGSDIVWTA